MGYIFKDKGAGPEHGEFTHILAIYIIVEENKINKFLHHDPLFLYQKMGSYPYIKYDKDFEDEASRLSPWDIIFDFTDEEYLNTPEILHKLLRGKTVALGNSLEDTNIAKDIPILSSLLQGRVEKRKTEAFEETVKKRTPRSGSLLNDSIFFKSYSSHSFVEATFDDILSETYIDPLTRAISNDDLLDTKTLINQLIGILTKITLMISTDADKEFCQLAIIQLYEWKEKNENLSIRNVATSLSRMQIDALGNKNISLVKIIEEAQFLLLLLNDKNKLSENEDEERDTTKKARAV